jgi:hypothetical protein
MRDMTWEGNLLVKNNYIVGSFLSPAPNRATMVFNPYSPRHTAFDTGCVDRYEAKKVVEAVVLLEGIV